MGILSRNITADQNYNEYLQFIERIEEFFADNLYIGDDNLYMEVNYETYEIRLLEALPDDLDELLLSYIDYHKIENLQTREVAMKRHYTGYYDNKVKPRNVTLIEDIIEYFKRNAFEYLIENTH